MSRLLGVTCLFLEVRQIKYYGRLMLDKTLLTDEIIDKTSTGIIKNIINGSVCNVIRKNRVIFIIIIQLY